MESLNEYIEWWNDLSVNKSDRRTSALPMMDSPIPSALICISYVIFVFVGQEVMKKREPFNLKTVIILYNFTMVALSGFIFTEFLRNGWLFDYSLGCQPVDYTDNPKANRMAFICWLFMMSKFVELLDTVFFILRKKNNQVTFLHVFHHGMMPTSWWFGVKFVPGGFGTFHAMLNSLIHFFMYSYYGLAASGENYKKYADFLKKYMTSMQMLQFLIVMIHSPQLLFIECDYPIIFVYVIFAYAFIFLVFFANFYRNTYKKSQKVDKKIK